MADSKEAIRKMLLAEGPYDNQGAISDPGGETVWGVDYANNHDPNDIITTALWKRMDELRTIPYFPLSVAKDFQINLLVNQYYERLWKQMGLNDMADQAFANAVFGAYHNQGPKVIKWLQQCLNALNNKLWPLDLKEDGLIGNSTIERVNKLLSNEDGAYLVDAFASSRKVGIISSGEKFPGRRINTRGLFNRINQGE